MMPGVIWQSALWPLLWMVSVALLVFRYTWLIEHDYHASRNASILRKLSFLASSHSPGQRFSAGIMCLSAHFGKPRISSRPSDNAWLPFS